MGHFGNQYVRRVSFFVDNERNLVMTQAPMLMAVHKDFEPYSLPLAKDVSLFLVEFWGQDKGQWKWVQEWSSTNQLPKMVRVVVGMGKNSKDPSKPQDVATRVIAMASMAIPPQLQGGGPMGPGGMGPGGMGPGGMGPGGLRQGGGGGMGAGGPRPGMGGGYQPGR